MKSETCLLFKKKIKLGWSGGSGEGTFYGCGLGMSIVCGVAFGWVLTSFALVTE